MNYGQLGEESTQLLLNFQHTKGCSRGAKNLPSNIFRGGMSKPGGQAGGPQGGAGQQGGNMRALSDKLIEDLRQGKIR